MKNKKLVIILMISGTLMILAGSFSSFFVNLKEDQEATKKRTVDVAEVYRGFSEQVDNFNDIRNDLYLSVFDQLYYENIGQIDAGVQESLKTYEKIVDDIAVTTKQLKNLCGNIYFTDTSTNTKCSSYASVYEQIVNAFVSDVKFYNESIDNYNDYQEKLKLNNSLNHYDTNKKYIDYNNDKKYEGKE